MRTHLAVLVVLPALGLSLLAQTSGAPPAAYKSSADIASELAKAVAKDPAAGAAIQVAPGISVRRRSSGGEPQYAIVHPFSMEIYYIVDGSASLVTGGTLDPPPPPPADPDTVRSTSIRGGETRKVGKGDVVVMPPGTPHWFNSIDGTVTYLESRVKVLAQQAPAGTGARNFDAEIRAALQSAKTAAGFDFLGTLARTCLLPQSGGENTTDTLPGYVTKPASAPARDTWYADPAKVFDNLYFVGGKLHSSWALTTSDGIILFDTIFPYNSEELIVGGLQKLGLNPKDIKYVVISHAHGDHIGGAEMLQTRYGARVVMGGPDWDLVAKYPNRYKTMAPKRDIVATDGMTITLGGTSVTIWATPGHTPGTLSYTFTVMDRGRPVNVAYSGGTAFNFVNNTPDPGIRNFQTYIESQRHMAAKAAASRATVLLSNHSEFDNAVDKNRMIAGRGNGPHPYELGADAVQRYFQVMQGCARAAQLGLEQQQAGQK